MNYIEIEELLKVGAHVGHPTRKWNPKFSPYIATKKNGVHIIDLNETNRCLNIAIQELTKIVKSNGNILFVGTKKQAKDVVQQAADRCGMYYIVERWLGGTLTNFGTIKRSIRRLFLLDKDSSELYANLTKKEQHMLNREKLKLADLHRGIKDMKHLPSALFFIDGIHERIAISEPYWIILPFPISRTSPRLGNSTTKPFPLGNRKEIGPASYSVAVRTMCINSASSAAAMTTKFGKFER